MLLILLHTLLHHAAADTNVASEINTFGLKLLQYVPPDKNIMISPFSICTAVAMLNAGTSGETKKQIDSAFGWSDSTDLSGQYKEFLTKVEGSEKDKFTLSSNNRLYIDNTFTPLQSYSNELTTNFGAEVEAVNFSNGDNSATVEQINTWVEEKTNEKIKKLFSDIDSGVRAILINTIYFKATWVDPFNQVITQDAFYLDEEYAIKTDTMHLEVRLPYFENKDIELVKLPYASEGSQRVSMVIIKPKTRAGLSSLEKKIGYQFSEVSSWMSSVEDTLLDLSMPKFQFKSGVDTLKEILMEDFQVLDVFDENKADLSGVSSSEDLFVSFITHKSFISVNENGTEAAAATAIGSSTTSVEIEPIPREVLVNQPFMFLIYDETNEVVLFVGRMVHPDSEKDSDKYLESRYISSGSSSSVKFAGPSLLLCIVAILLQ